MPSSSTTTNTKKKRGIGADRVKQPRVDVAVPAPVPAPVETAFIWGVGIECSFLPHIDVDQFEWTQHDRFWREDFRRIREELGSTHMRYAFPWHKIEITPGQYDWTSADERMAYAKEIGLELILDVMHFGTPKWLPLAVGDPRFPEALESFTTAMVNRYKSQVKIWCPYNEPLVSALFSGDFGFWPPFQRKWRGYMPVLSRIVQALNRSIAAVRRAQPEATVLLCDALENYQSRSPELTAEVAMRNLRRFVILDLLAGRVDHHHPLYSWLTSFGFSELDLSFLANNPQMPDLIGLDYYPHSDWQIEMQNGRLRQRRADAPLGLGALARAVYDRYGLPLMVTETSVDGPPISREIWLHRIVDEIRELREDGIPMTGLIWWPALDQIDWDGALTHRIGKLHHVGLFSLNRLPDGTLERKVTPLAKQWREIVEAGDEHVGELAELAISAAPQDVQLPPLLTDASQWVVDTTGGAVSPTAYHANGDKGNGSNMGSTLTAPRRISEIDDGAGLAGEAGAVALATDDAAASGSKNGKSTDRYGFVVFSHLRWGFVWQRPQQFLSRFARYHPILFVEEPFFDLPAGEEARMDLHSVMPNVTVMCPHCPPEMARDENLPSRLRAWVRDAMKAVNTRGEFDRPLLWYYSPMDTAWSLGHFANRGIVYDCMDELSAFTGAPPTLITNERRLIEHADIVFTGGYELWTKKTKLHPNAQFYGCGVESDHFGKAADASTSIPPDVDFLPRPIIGWFGVVDERVDYHLIAECARLRPDWTFALVGPVVKVDPNLLPHAPNIHWLGQRDYQQLPNYCAAYDVCMMSFAINAATEFINPTKALEYLATGRPVVSTPVRDVVRQYSDYVEIAATPAEFVAKIEQALNNPDHVKIQAGIELARGKSWESTVKNMRQNIADSITGSAKRSSAAKPEPDPEPGTLYLHTQGS
ncbi:MAG: glycosyltransferase [Burkholderiales bacterium]|nr:glycosyltransferase [Phycisphaerae bacterium]